MKDNQRIVVKPGTNVLSSAEGKLDMEHWEIRQIRSRILVHAIPAISEFIPEQSSSGGRDGMVSRFNTAGKAIHNDIQV